MLASKRSERVSARQCLELLYQTGPALEVAVKAVLHELGAVVEEADEPGHTDCLLRVSTSRGTERAIVEIKGIYKPQFDLKGFRQLLQWRNDAVLKHDVEFRAIFVGNSSITLPPHEREDCFTKHWKTHTELSRFTALTTVTLYDAYCRFREGKLKAELFWDSLLTTHGIFTLAPIVDEK